MFRNTYQNGFLSIFYSIGSNPLLIWKSNIQNGHMKRLTDDSIKSVVLELMGANVATSYITTPNDNHGSLGIKLPFFLLVIKNLQKVFSFEIQILDDNNVLRRFRFSNYQSSTRVQQFSTTMPLGLSTGWNEVQLNLADITRRCYATNYVETVRVQIHANVRIRRVYFSDRLYAEEEKPPQFRLLIPSKTKVAKRGKNVKTKQPPSSPAGDESRKIAVTNENQEVDKQGLPSENIQEPQLEIVEQPAEVIPNETGDNLPDVGDVIPNETGENLPDVEIIEEPVPEGDDEFNNEEEQTDVALVEDEAV